MIVKKSKLAKIRKEIQETKMTAKVRDLLNLTIDQINLGNVTYARGLTKAIADLPEADFELIDFASSLEKITEVTND